MENVRQLLKAYQIEPTEIIPITNRLYKIHSHNYTFALKRSKLTNDKLEHWMRVYQQANDQQITSILPVYMTRNGDIFHQDRNDIYYLTPWKEKKEIDEPKHETESFYYELATIHQKARRETSIRSNQLEQIIYQERAKMNEYRNRLLAYIETFEQRHYMSPFELRVCMQYRDLEHVFGLLDDWYEYYLEDVGDDGHGYQALCHGNLRASHKIYQNHQTYFINWEHAFFGNPVNDLARYYYNEFKYHDSYLDQLVESFSIYERYNPLLQSERSLLAIYLLSPTNYIRVVDTYLGGKWDKAQPFKIRTLEHSYRRLMQGLRMQQHLYQIREQIKEQELEQEIEED